MPQITKQKENTICFLVVRYTSSVYCWPNQFSNIYIHKYILQTYNTQYTILYVDVSKVYLILECSEWRISNKKKKKRKIESKSGCWVCRYLINILESKKEKKKLIFRYEIVQSVWCGVDLRPTKGKIIKKTGRKKKQKENHIET